MAAMRAALSLPSLSSSSCSKFSFYRNPPLGPSKLQVSNYLWALSLKFPFSPLLCPPRKFGIQQCSTVQEVIVEGGPEQSHDPLLRRKIYVANFSRSFTAADFKTLFGQCGTVTDVEVISSSRIVLWSIQQMALKEQSQCNLSNQRPTPPLVSGDLCRVVNFVQPPQQKPRPSLQKGVGGGMTQQQQKLKNWRPVEEDDHSEVEMLISSGDEEIGKELLLVA